MKEIEGAPANLSSSEKWSMKRSRKRTHRSGSDGQCFLVVKYDVCKCDLTVAVQTARVSARVRDADQTGRVPVIPGGCSTRPRPTPN